MRCLDGITDAMDMNLGKLWEMVRVREAWPAAIHGVTRSWTQLGDWYAPPHMTEGQYPIEQQGVTLTYWMDLNGGAAKYINSQDENPRVFSNTKVQKHQFFSAQLSL